MIANAASTDAATPALIGIRHVESTGFKIRLQYIIDTAGAVFNAVAGFLVLERGTYTRSDGTLMETGRLATTPSARSLTVPFSSRFNRVLVVMTSIISPHEAEPVMSRIQSVMKSALHVELFGGGPATHAGGIATLAYIALEPSARTLQGGTFEAQRTQDIALGQWYSLAFLGVYGGPPVLLAEVQGGGFGHPLTLRCDVKNGDGVEVTIDAGSYGDDANHAPAAVVGYIALR